MIAMMTEARKKTNKRRAAPKHSAALISAKPYYITKLGAAYRGNALDLLKQLPDKSVNAIITSPPYALYFKKAYGNVSAKDYVDWFMPFAKEFRRVLRTNGSLVIEIGGAWNKGLPTRSVYHFDLLVRLVNEAKFHLAEEFFWFNRTRIPSPAEWVNVRRIRVKDAVTPIWWLSPSPWPSANNRRVLRDYSPDMLKLFKNGYNGGKRPSGHIARGFEKNNGGAIPPNLIEIAHTSSQDGYQQYCRDHELDTHPARFPKQVPEFFVKFLTQTNGLILDPFSGSNMTGYVAELLGRRWISFELNTEYVRGSMGRFLAGEDLPITLKRGRSLPAWIQAKSQLAPTKLVKST